MASIGTGVPSAKVSRVCPKMPPLQIRIILTLNYASMEDGDASDVDID